MAIGNLAFLGLAVVLSVVGCLVLWMRRRKPKSMEATVREFARELAALAPETPSDDARSRLRRGRRSG
jgi:uncharacterized iron-regulated membrane protein